MAVSRSHTVDLVFKGQSAHQSLRPTGRKVQQSRPDRLDVRLRSSALVPMLASRDPLSWLRKLHHFSSWDTRFVHGSSLIAASVLSSPAEEVHDSPRGTTATSMVVATVP